MKTFSCIFPESVLYYRSTCRCDGMVDVVDSKTSSPSVAGIGKRLGESSVFQILFFICLSHPSCVSLQIPGGACLGVKKYICRCVGIGRRGGLKIRWANNPCGFDPRHRHHTLKARKPLIRLGLRAFLYALSSYVLSLPYHQICRLQAGFRRDIGGT